MKVIFSNVKYPFSPSSSWVELGALSNFYAKNLGFETIFFGDEQSLQDYKNIEFNHFERISNEEINHFPKCLWSMGKLISLTKVKEPVIHIDLDIILKENFNIDRLNNDIVCLHDEMFVDNNMHQLQKIFKDRKPLEAQNAETRSYNCGIMGGNDYYSLHQSINIIFDYVIKKYAFIENINSQYANISKYKWLFHPPVLVEQIWLFQILKSHLKKNISTIIPSAQSWRHVTNLLLQNGIIHLMQNKNNEIVRANINRRVQELNLKY